MSTYYFSYRQKTYSVWLPGFVQKWINEYRSKKYRVPY